MSGYLMTPVIAGVESSLRRMAVVEMLIVPTFSRDAASLPRDCAMLGCGTYGATAKV